MGESERNCRSIKMCLRYTLIISNALLALLGLLLLAGGVWLIVDEKSFEETAGNVLDDEKVKDEIDSHEGLRDALEEVYGHNYFNYALLEWAASPSLWLYSASVEPRRKTSVCSPSTASASSSSSFSRLLHLSLSTLKMRTSTSSVRVWTKSWQRAIWISPSLRRSGPSLPRTCSLACLPA